MSRDLLEIAALDAAALPELLDMAERPLGTPLAGRGVAMLFEKPSARTRSSTEMAAVQLGAHPVYIQKDEVGIGTRETPEDVARTLDGNRQTCKPLDQMVTHDSLQRGTDADAQRGQYFHAVKIGARPGGIQQK